MLRAIPLSDKAVLSTSVMIDWEGVRFLLDAGPGITKEIYDRRLGLAQLQFVLISHSHIDHFWDLVPLLWLRKMLGCKRELTVICPKNELQLFEWCAKVSQASDLAKVIGMEPTQRLELAGLEIAAFQVEHAKDQLCLGYSVSEKMRRKLRTEKLAERGVPVEFWRKIARGEVIEFKGENLNPSEYSYMKRRKIVYSGDTGPCKELIEASKKASLLIVEATFLDESYRSLAEEYGHMIVEDAIKIALDSGIENVLLTHRSLRHLPEEVLSAARKVISNISDPPRLFVGMRPVAVD